MKLNCPSCAAPISAAQMNVATDVALLSEERREYLVSALRKLLSPSVTNT